jgi:monovalent cation/hydrogen antiporter
LEQIPGEGAAALRAEYEAVRAGSVGRAQPNTEYDNMRRRAIAAERQLLADWRRRRRIQDDVYHLLENELDRAELHVSPMSSTWLDG